MANKKGMKRRMKKQVRRTLGALFMVAAILVAMIPTRSIQGGEVQAANSCTGVIAPEYYIIQSGTGTTKTPVSEIPVIQPGSTIYTTADQTYYFAYINSQGVDEIGNAAKFAIITGYNASGAVNSNGDLTIPSTVRSFRKLSDVEGYCLTNVSNEFLFYRDTDSFISNEYTVAVGDPNPLDPYIGDYVNGSSTVYSAIQALIPDEKRANPGYYSTIQPDQIALFKASETPNYDDTDPTLIVSYTYTYTIENVRYYPCTASTESVWKAFPKDSLYYRDGAPGSYTYKACSDSSHQYVDNIPVKYIANQFSVYDTATSTYVLSTQPIDDEHKDNGVFASSKGTNIKHLYIPDSMEGIGDYAFYGCVALTEINFSNQLLAIGNHAFDGCRALENVFMDSDPRITTIGAYAFANCPSLKSFYVPHQIKLLCDGVFENDTSLTSVDLTGDINADPTGNGSALTQVGNHLFYGCSSLREVTFGTAIGAGYSLNNKREIPINIFEDCPSLTKITVLSPFVTFVDDTHDAVSGTPSYPACKFTLKDFHDILTDDSFYFEGVDPAGATRPNIGVGALHSTCQNMDKGYEFTFKYYGEELYENTVTEEGDGKAIYQVDNTNSLVGFTTVEDGSNTVQSLSFPEHFGPYYINEIPAEKFLNLKNLSTVRLPSTVNVIGDRAFQGCINLQYVYFGNDNVQIGKDAFLTQGAKTDPKPATDTNNNPVKQLYFVTSISEDSKPFAYAMSDGGKFNHDLQNRSWPIIYSGFPTLLEVKYNPDKGCAELTNFPTSSSLSGYSTAWYLTDNEKSAIGSFSPSSPATTFDYQLLEVCETLTIPKGVKSIQDGLFNHNTSLTNTIAVVSEGLDEIDVTYTPNSSYEELVYNSSPDSIDVTFTGIGTVDPTQSDFAGCPGLTSITFQGNGKVTVPDYAFYNCDQLESVNISQQVDSLGKQAFSECDNLMSAELYGVTEIQDHAFLGDPLLADVTISADTSVLGLAPFRLCNNLNNVKFGDNTHYTTSNGIIYGLDSSGNKYSIIEFLGGRSSKTVQTAEVEGITGIAKEAFADTSVQIANFESSHITTLPQYAFDDCDNLVSVYLPDGCRKIEDFAFRGSTLSNLTVNDKNLNGLETGMNLVQTTYDFAIDQDHGVNYGENHNITVYAPAVTDDDGNVIETSLAYDFFKDRRYTVEALVPIVHYYVTYWDFATPDASKRTVRVTEEYTEGDTVTVLDPLRAVSEGFIFNYYENRNDTDETYAYRDKFEIHSDIDLQAVYEGVQEISYTATFIDVDPSTGADGAVLVSGIPVESKSDSNGNTVYYINGSMISGIAPTKPGYTFKSWSPFDPRNSYEFDIKDANISSTDNSVIVFRAFYQSGSNGNGGSSDPTVTHKASYYMPDGTTLYTQIDVKDGDAAYNIKVPDGYSGYEWSPTPTETIMRSDQRFVLVPSEGNNNGASNSYTATYYYSDGVTVYQTLSIEAGGTPPDLMMPAGYKQCKWSPDPSSVSMDKNMRFTMVNNPNYEGDDDGYTGPFYTLTVVGGSGSGSYKPGAQVVIVADDLKTNTVFSSWTIAPASTPIASKVLSATVVTMPAENVTVTANFVARTAGNGNNGAGGNGSGGNNGGGNNYWPSTGNVPRSSGTTVVIDKNGLSNTGVVSATVNGSTDNFTIKVTESQTANKLVLDALLKKYGTVDNIIYFPFDISLYDAAGTTQITDTSGLTITITLPLPDSMIEYAANNKVAVITNNEIDPLNARFTTINGVPCVTFTCTHFSPYVIYVNTVEMSAGGYGGGNGTGLDNTPKTADFIHPKWFISIALFAISIVLFLMKDKTGLKTVKAASGNARKRK